MVRACPGESEGPTRQAQAALIHTPVPREDTLMTRRRTLLTTPSQRDQVDFLEAVRRSRALHRPWAYPPSTPERFATWLARLDTERNASWLVRRRDDDTLVGVINLNEIVGGSFLSGYLGYYAFRGQERQGLMHEGLSDVLAEVFGPRKLHRVEANIQPENEASIALVQGLGFRQEGYSPRYLKIGGRWRDHERWALLAEDWRLRSRTRA